MPEANGRPGTLVTGASGFIASHLCESLLARGHRVVGLDGMTDSYDLDQKQANLDSLRQHEGFDFVPAHLLDADLDLDKVLGGVQYVFHLAARAGVREGWTPTNFQRYMQDNSRSTQRLADAALRAGVKLFSFASTSSIYGFNPRMPTPEDHPLEPRSFYAMTKLLDEHLLSSYHRLFGLPVVVLRYYTLFGPRQRPDMLVHIGLKAIATGKPITIYGDGEQTRELTYVADAVDAQVRVLDALPIGETFNIGSGPTASVNELIGTMEQVAGKPAERIYAEAHPADQLHSQADTSRARRVLGFDPSTTIHEGIAAEYAWMQEAVLR
ncbi:MAG: NAD-dependent epimerase/dehydratase family protein [Chloroflexota bacterium]|nr:NAD-dependent epimerase/dehydratase family protein [Chloroflexota bacterium]MDE2896765.1 NAD-dependent epimerase/dehydratase family protein [Chloroflexota bacterium]